MTISSSLSSAPGALEPGSSTGAMPDEGADAYAYVDEDRGGGDMLLPAASRRGSR